MIPNARRGTLFPDCKRDAHPHLYAENIVRGARKFRIPAYVSVQVDVIDSLEVAQKMLAHAVEGYLVYEAVVRHKADDAVE